MIHSGCVFGSVGDSCLVETSDLVAEVIVLDSDELIRASAEFHSGFVRLELCEEDVLTINGVQATKIDKTLHIEYGVTWDRDDRPNDFDVVLTRDEQELSLAQVTLPPAFELTSPQSGDRHSRAQPFQVLWEPPLADAEIEVRIEDELAGPCRTADNAPDYTQGIEVADTGEHEVAAGSFEYSEILGTDGTCNAFVELRRMVLEDAASEFDADSTVTARVQRRADFVLEP